MAASDTFEDAFAEDQATVECRSCNEEMPVDQNHCPHCGSRVITRVEAGLLAAGGLVLAAGTGLVGLWPLAAIGVVALVAGVAMYRNRDQKVKNARQ